MSAPEERPDGLPRRTTESRPLPEAFRPLPPLSGPERGDGAARRPPPRSRLVAGPGGQARVRYSAPHRVRAPDDVAAPVVARQAPEPQLEVAAPSRPATRRTVAVVVSALVAFGVVVGGTVLLRGGGTETAAAVGGAGADAPRRTPQPVAPVTLAPGSEYVRTGLDGDRLRVEHWARSAGPVERLELRVPHHPGLDDAELAIDNLRVLADGRDVDLRADARVVALPDATEVYVAYELAGAVSTAGSVADRALATVTALDLDLGASLDRTQAFPSGQVMTLACLAAGTDAIPEPCGALRGSVWEVESTTDRPWDTVIAQFDLTSQR